MGNNSDDRTDDDGSRPPKRRSHLQPFGKFLKEHYDRVLEEEVPTNLKLLAEKLDQKLAEAAKNSKP